MKAKHLLLVLVILVFGTMMAAAQGPGQGMGPQGGGRRGGRGMMMNADRLSQELNLTPEQKTKVEGIFQEQRTQMMALRQDSSVSQDDRREKMEKIRETTHNKIRDVLTSEQKEKFDKMGQGRGPGGPPQEAPPNQ
jgi:protein CpxP